MSLESILGERATQRNATQRNATRYLLLISIAAAFVMSNLIPLEATYINPTDYLYSYPGHEEWDYKCKPCEFPTEIESEFYGYTTVDNTPTYLFTEIPYYRNGQYIGDIISYFRFKATKICFPEIDGSFNFQGILVDIWKVCFRFSNPTSDPSTAPSAAEMIKSTQYEIGTNTIYYFHVLSNDPDPDVRDWWRNDVWGEEDGLATALYFVSPCSMQENLVSVPNSSPELFSMICWEKCSDDCCIYKYVFTNRIEEYPYMGGTRKCINHWICQLRIHSQPTVCNFDSYAGDCKNICSEELFAFETNQEYIKDNNYKNYAANVLGCPYCASSLPKISIPQFDGQVKTIEVFDLLGVKLLETEPLSLEEKLKNGVYFIRYHFEDENKVRTEKILICK